MGEPLPIHEFGRDQATLGRVVSNRRSNAAAARP
jgi:hypothetical protein